MWKKRHSLSPKILSHSQLPPLGYIPAPVWPSGLTDNPGETFWSTLDLFVRREENVLQLAAFRALAPITVFMLKYIFCIYYIYKKILKQHINTLYYNLLCVETDPARLTTSYPHPLLQLDPRLHSLHQHWYMMYFIKSVYTFLSLHFKQSRRFWILIIFKRELIYYVTTFWLTFKKNY